MSGALQQALQTIGLAPGQPAPAREAGKDYKMIDGVLVELDAADLAQRAADQAAQAAAPRIITGVAFLALWTPVEIAAAMAVPELLAGALKVAAQGSANLSSAECAALLALAVQRGVITAQRRDRIAQGLPPA